MLLFLILFCSPHFRGQNTVSNFCFSSTSSPCHKMYSDSSTTTTAVTTSPLLLPEAPRPPCPLREDRNDRKDREDLDDHEECYEAEEEPGRPVSVSILRTLPPWASHLLGTKDDGTHSHLLPGTPETLKHSVINKRERSTKAHLLRKACISFHLFIVLLPWLNLFLGTLFSVAIVKGMPPVSNIDQRHGFLPGLPDLFH